MGDMEDFFKFHNKPKPKTKKKNMDFLEGVDTHKLSPYGDKDRDGVPNWDDCKPYDPNKDGWIMDRIRGKQREETNSERMIAKYKTQEQSEKYEGTTPGHTESDKLTKQYHKEHPERKTLMQRLADNRKAAAKEKTKYQAAYREEFNKQRMVSLKARAKQEAREKYRPTRKQKMDNLANAIGNLGDFGGVGTSTQQRRKTSSSKKKHKKSKQKFTVIGGRAYPIAKQHQQSQVHHKKKKKKTSSGAFDLGGLDNIGDFNF